MRDRPVMDLGRVVLRDDRGRAWRVWMPVRLGRLAGFGTRLPSPLRRDLRTRLFEDVPVFTRLGFVIAFVTVGVVTLAVARLLFELVRLAALPDRLDTLAMTASVIMLIGVQLVAVDLVTGRESRRHYRRIRIQTLLAAGHCPLCGYIIAAAPVESDGCKVCPECGGAWRKPGSAAAA